MEVNIFLYSEHAEINQVSRHIDVLVENYFHDWKPHFSFSQVTFRYFRAAAIFSFDVLPCCGLANERKNNKYCRIISSVSGCTMVWFGIDTIRVWVSPHVGAILNRNRIRKLVSTQNYVSIFSTKISLNMVFNPLAPNEVYICRTAQLTSRRCILNNHSTNIVTEYFKHGTHSPFIFSLQGAVYFIMLPFLVPVIFTF